AGGAAARGQAARYRPDLLGSRGGAAGESPDPGSPGPDPGPSPLRGKDSEPVSGAGYVPGGGQASPRALRRAGLSRRSGRGGDSGFGPHYRGGGHLRRPGAPARAYGGHGGADGPPGPALGSAAGRCLCADARADRGGGGVRRQTVAVVNARGSVVTTPL